MDGRGGQQRTQQVFKDMNLDYEERSLWIVYDTIVYQGDAAGNIIGKQATTHKKRIRLSIDRSTDIPDFAERIVSQVDLIPKSKLPLLVELLFELQHHVTSGGGGGGGGGGAGSSSSANTSLNNTGGSLGTTGGGRGRAGSSSSSGGGGGAGLGATGGSLGSTLGSTAAGSSAPSRPIAIVPLDSGMSPSGEVPFSGMVTTGPAEGKAAESDGEDHAREDDCEDYLEKLYEEETELKLQGARKLLYLVQRSGNLRIFVKNQTLLGALTRVLKDDWKKSTELTLTLLQIFYCFSHYKQLHSILISSRIGDLSLKVIDLENRRFTARMQDLQRYTQLAELQKAGDKAGEAAFRARDAEQRRAEEEDDAAAAAVAAEKAAAEKGSSGGAGAAAGGAGSAGGAGGDAEGATAAADVVKRVKLKPLPPGAVELEKERKKVKALTAKQEALLFVAVHILLNLAEDVTLESKMHKRNIVGLLLPILDHDNPVLVRLALTFLRKLSVYEENKSAMVRLRVAERLHRLLPDAAAINSKADPQDPCISLQAAALRLTYNLTLDPESRLHLLQAGIQSKLGPMLKHPRFRRFCLQAMYHLTLDSTLRGEFVKGNTIQLMLRLCINFPQPLLEPEVAALAINLCSNPAVAEVICASEAVKPLTLRAIKNTDILLMKAVRHLSSYTYALQSDECLKAAAAEEERWRMAHQRQYIERKMRAAVAGAASGSGRKGSGKRGRARSGSGFSRRSGEGKFGDEEEEEQEEGGAVEGKEELPADGGADDDEEEGDGAADAPLVVPPMPNEVIGYEYPLEGVWTGLLPELLQYAQLVEKKRNHPMLVEVLGVLSNMTPADMSERYTLADQLEDDNISAMLQRVLDPRTSPDDVLLCAVELLCNYALDPDCAPVIASSSIPRLLADILAEKSGDTDVILQTVEAVLRLLHHEETREAITETSKVPQRLVEFLSHTHPILADNAMECVHIMIEHDREHGSSGIWQQLQARRFQLYNREFVSRMAMQQAAARGGGGGGHHHAAHGGHAGRRAAAGGAAGLASGSYAGQRPVGASESKHGGGGGGGYDGVEDEEDADYPGQDEGQAEDSGHYEEEGEAVEEEEDDDEGGRGWAGADHSSTHASPSSSPAAGGSGPSSSVSTGRGGFSTSPRQGGFVTMGRASESVAFDLSVLYDSAAAAGKAAAMRAGGAGAEGDADADGGEEHHGGLDSSGSGGGSYSSQYRGSAADAISEDVRALYAKYLTGEVGVTAGRGTAGAGAGAGAAGGGASGHYHHGGSSGSNGAAVAHGSSASTGGRSASGSYVGGWESDEVGDFY